MISYCHVWNLESARDKSDRVSDFDEPYSATDSPDDNYCHGYFRLPSIPSGGRHKFVTTETKVAVCFPNSSSVFVYDLSTQRTCTFSISPGLVFMTFSANATQLITVHFSGNSDAAAYITDDNIIKRSKSRELTYDAGLDVFRYNLDENMHVHVEQDRLHLPLGREWVVDEALSRARDDISQGFNDRAKLFVVYDISNVAAAWEVYEVPLIFVMYDICRDRIVLRFRGLESSEVNSLVNGILTTPVTSDLFYFLYLLPDHDPADRIRVDSLRQAECMDVYCPDSEDPGVFYHHPLIYGDCEFIIVLSVTMLEVFCFDDSLDPPDVVPRRLTLNL